MYLYFIHFGLLNFLFFYMWLATNTTVNSCSFASVLLIYLSRQQRRTFTTIEAARLESIPILLVDPAQNQSPKSKSNPWELASCHFQGKIEDKLPLNLIASPKPSHPSLLPNPNPSKPLFLSVSLSCPKKRNGAKPSSSPLRCHSPTPNRYLQAPPLQHYPPTSYTFSPIPRAQISRPSLPGCGPIHPVHHGPMPRESFRRCLLAPQLRLQLQRPASYRDGPAFPGLRLRALAHRHGQARRRGCHQAADDRLLRPNPCQSGRQVFPLFFCFREAVIKEREQNVINDKEESDLKIFSLQCYGSFCLLTTMLSDSA